MLVPLSWLRDFAPFELDPVALGEVFDDLGMVVEAITPVGVGLEDVVVARVVSVDPIEGADKIRKIMVDAGEAEPLQIVCGAWNFGVGDTVPLAPVGAVLPGDFLIGQRKMKGVVSQGMLCSARELGLGQDQAGLLVLSDGLQPGQPLTDALGITSDVVYDLAIEGNRPDANCMAGVARDAAARLGLPFAIPAPPKLASEGGDSGFVVNVEAPDLCDRFTATVFNGLLTADSPQWLARRLTLAGMRPISNVVDASNYVMLELGQPTHAYDLDRLPAPVLGARAARHGEQLETLDGVLRTLGDGPNPDCVITDATDRAIGIAGVMGGASSEVHDGTTRVALEAAHFVPMAVARTSKRLGLRSEASARFERGVDIDGIDLSVARFAEILGATAPGLRAVGATVDWRAPGAGVTPPLVVRVSKVNALLGTELSAERIAELLTPIGFGVSPPVDDELRVIAPTFRPDAVSEVDVIEEIARHHGYSRVARTTVRPPQVGMLSEHQRVRRLVREVLTGAGVSEAMTSPLVGPGDHERAGLPDRGIAAADPLVQEESILRTSLRPGLLRAVSFNTDRRNPDIGLFEIGRVWPEPGVTSVGVASEAEPGNGLPPETETLGLVVAGVASDGRPADATTAVRLVRRVVAALGIEDVRLVAGESLGLHPTRAAEIVINGESAGHVGEVDPAVVDSFGIAGRVAWIEVDVAPLVAARSASKVARPASRFPSSDLDLAFLVEDRTPADDVERTLRRAGGELLERVTLFDVYRGPGVPAGSRGLAFRLRLVATDHTLTDAELADVRGACIAAVEAAQPARLRE